MSIKPSTGGPSALTWVKSSYSASSSNDCVEVAWFKSSYSASDSNDCVEVAMLPEAILIRDSKVTDGPRLAVGPVAWTGFVGYATRRR
ncbi:MULTISPECIES: DUF397 domain-containing protein [unclassified Streptomyces]|uniref:DUF397 domain-containing protein n=1 Tax=unclassified Streptomyces TaxID=2593676 RepID=UPI000DC795D0|nr:MULTISPECIES: DUF397 domain-containing protein [unclassified Streptomyces]AWZ08419.1 DUF397 domain-containing protein [Streptomyces sp. ICC4]AWZ16180.1 DUF397 domain-containing protein [Streptomyces sp. ICC1]